MKSEQLEILLFTDTNFSSRQLCEKYGPGNQNNYEIHRSLEIASWNGLFQETLPELYRNTADHKKLILWKVTHAEHFLELEYGQFLQLKDKFLSLNPYLFLPYQHLS